jgi:hypothetical protein
VKGYGVHGTQWEQLAIGCWGETFCMDMEMALARRTICDIRMLMTAGKVSKKWRFTDAGWGGDWLSILGNDGQRKKPFCWKTAYNSYGPCLTDVSNVIIVWTPSYLQPMIHTYYTPVHLLVGILLGVVWG